MKKSLLLLLLFVLVRPAISQTYVAQIKVKKEGWGYIDHRGKEVVVPQFEICTKFSKDGLAIYQNPKKNIYGFLNLKGETTATIKDNSELISYFGYGITGFNDGLLAVNTKKNDNWGFMDQFGKYVVQPQFDKVTPFNGGYATGKDGRYCYIIHKSGKMKLVEDKTVRMVEKFSENLAPFLKGGFYGYMDTTGKEIITPNYISVGEFSGGLAWVKTNDNKVGYIDKSGKIIVKPKYLVGNEFDPESGVARVKDLNGWGYTSTKEYLGNLNTGADTYREFKDGLCLARKDGLFGYFNNKGEWVIKPQFKGGRDFKNGFAAVKQDKYWGVIDKSGNWVIKPSFEGIKDFELVE